MCADHMEGGGSMPSAKQEAIELIQSLPDDSTLEDIQYHLYVRQKVLRGLRDVEEGRFQTQEDVEKRMKKWLSE
jgi:predicted transcriptional regulator